MYDLERSIAGGYNPIQHTVTMRDPSTGQLVTMDLGTGDVHIDAALSTYISGFRNAEFGADRVSPIVVVNKASDFYFQWSPDNELSVANQIEVAPGADPTEINPLLATQQYITKGYALASVIPMEVIANQDAPLNIEMAAAKMLMGKLLLSREVRTMQAAFTQANYSSAAGLVTVLGPTQKWNNGSASNPVRDIKNLMELSLMVPTDMALSLDTWNQFCENPGVQKYLFAKPFASALPEKNRYDEWAGLLEIPRPNVIAVKSKNKAGAYPYVWTGNVTLIRRPPGDAVSMFDASTFKTFRWNGAGGPTLPGEMGGTVQGGFTVRSFYNPLRGKRGVRTVIVAHDDFEAVTGGLGNVSLVGGLIVGAIQ
jgi:hypothetical protein